jgi:hypothetical protein
MKVLPVDANRTRGEYGIYVVEFEAIERVAFEGRMQSGDPEALYELPMRPSSSVLYTLSPRVKALG